MYFICAGDAVLLSWGQAMFLAIVQGVTELFPVSSLGHTVVLPVLLGWGAVQGNETFLPFIVLLHVGTAVALLLFYWRTWAAIVGAFLTSAYRGRLSHTPDEHLAWSLFFGTIPAGLLGFLFEKPLKHLFGAPIVAAVFLIVNGVIMLLTEYLRRSTAAPDEADGAATSGVGVHIPVQARQPNGVASPPVPSATSASKVAASQTPRAGAAVEVVASNVPVATGAASSLGTSSLATSPLAAPAGSLLATRHGRRTIQDLTWRDAVIIGTAQALALIPGISRSGVTMCAGLLAGMHHDEAAQYTFLLATPLIAAAALLEVPVLFGAGQEFLIMSLVGGVLAGVTAYLSIRFLTRYFRVGKLNPFAYYCMLIGAATLVVLAVRGA